MFELAFAAQLGRPIYINFEQDLLSFPHVPAVRAFEKLTPDFGISPTHARSLQYLWVKDRHHQLTCLFAKWSCATFPGLRHLLVMTPIPPTGWSKSPDD